MSWPARRSHTLAELQQRLTQFEVPHSKIHSIADTLADPQIQARQAVIQLADPELGEIPAPCVVPRFSNHQAPTPRSEPGVGEHNEEVYGALGQDTALIAALRDRGVI